MTDYSTIQSIEIISQTIMRFFVLAVILPLAFAETPHCPVQPTCKAHEMICDGPPVAKSHDGCPPLGSCLPRENPTMKDSNGLPCPNGCPTHCQPNQLHCSSAAVNGCPMPGFCLDGPAPATAGAKAACAVFCPIVCENGLLPCPGKPDANGCPTQGTCAKDPADCTSL